VRAIPGYTLLTEIAGGDLLTGRPVSVTRTELIQELLAYGPFGAAVGPVLQTLDVVDGLFDFISEGLTANRLTLDRLRGDVDAAWERLSWDAGIEGNLAIVRGYVDALLADVRAFVGSIVERVLQVVRAAVAAVAEPLLQTPPIAPVWDLAKKVLRYDPLLDQPVEATTAEILADFLRLIGEEQRLAQMEERGTLQQTADWLDTQLATFSSLLDDLRALFSDAWAAIQPENLPGLLETLPALAGRAFTLIVRVRDFAATVIGKALELIKNALLGWLSQHAYAIPGFRLLTVIIGQNPFTGEAVERTAENLIGGFIALLPNGEATYQQLAESGVIAEAAARIESAMSRLNISLDLIVGTFRGIWDSLTLDDLLAPVAAFDRVVAAFGEPLGRIFEFVGVVVETVVSLVLRLMNFPSDLLASIVANVAAAITDIQRDPVGFLVNLLEALKLGLTGFFDHIVTYLVQGLSAWLFRGLGQVGITIPPDLSLQSILGLVLQVLGLTVEHLWSKLGEHIGPERVALIRGALDRLGEAWAFIVDVQQRGLVAVWEYISSQLGNLWDTLLGMAQEWIMTTIVTNVTARLLSLLDPTGVMAVVNSFVAFFNAVQSAIEYLRDILEIVNRYVSTLAQIAAGNINPGAQTLEQGLAAAIPIAIGFLANQVGIGNIPEKIVEIIGRLRELVDRALDWLIAQALRLGQAALNALGLGGQEGAAAAPTDAPEERFSEFGVEHRLYVDTGGTEPVLRVNPPPPVDLATYAAGLRARIEALPDATPAETATRNALLTRMTAIETDITQGNALLSTLFGERAPARARRPAGLDRTLTVLANRIEDLNNVLRNGAGTGTRSDPIPIQWFKEARHYEPIEITVRGEPRTLAPGLHHLAHPEQLGVSEAIGIGAASHPNTLRRLGRGVVNASRPLQRPPSGATDILRRTAGTDAFENFLRPYGWTKPTGWAIDHVQDLAFSGADEIDNMWPVPQSVNLTFNRTLDQPVAVWEAGPGGTMTLRRSTPKQLTGKYVFVAE
jgi:hypothetical protein